jgi:hypothetical protein
VDYRPSFQSLPTRRCGEVRPRAVAALDHHRSYSPRIGGILEVPCAGVGGFFISTNPDRSRCFTSRSAVMLRVGFQRCRSSGTSQWPKSGSSPSHPEGFASRRWSRSRFRYFWISTCRRRSLPWHVDTHKTARLLPNGHCQKQPHPDTRILMVVDGVLTHRGLRTASAVPWSGGHF